MSLIIAIDGVDGAGKTTLIDTLGRYLNNNGYSYSVVTAVTSKNNGLDMSGLPDISNSLYSVISQLGYDNSTSWYFIYAGHQYALDRALATSQKFNDIVVFMDRSLLSMMVYQDCDTKQQEDLIFRDLLPRYNSIVDWTILLSPPAEVIEERLASKGKDEIESAIDVEYIINDYKFNMGYIDTETTILTDQTFIELELLQRELISKLKGDKS